MHFNLRRSLALAQVALVRTMLLIGADDYIHSSNIVESIQLRVFRAAGLLEDTTRRLGYLRALW